MSTPDQNASVPDFFKDMGVTDDSALHAFMVVMGLERPRHELETIRATVLHGCYRNPDALGVGLFQFFSPNEPEGRLGISALIGLRKFNEVEFAVQARIYASAELHGSIPVLQRNLGENVPDWFFPALCLLAREVKRECGSQPYGYGLRRFAQRIEEHLKFWALGGADGEVAVTADLLSSAFPALATHHFPNRWLLPTPQELAAAQN